MRLVETLLKSLCLVECFPVLFPKGPVNVRVCLGAGFFKDFVLLFFASD